MPELPDITAYVEAIEERFGGHRLERLRVTSPFLVRSYDPPVKAVDGKRVTELRRIGKRVVFGLEDDLWIVVHLMIAGRFKLVDKGKAVPKRNGLAAFDFDDGTLLLTEASKKKRASLHVARGEAGLAELDPGGVEVIGIERKAFAAALTEENHTLKRTMTDPHVFSGIGNAYSDEILHHAKLSPVKWTQRLSDEEIDRLHASTELVLTEWCDRLREERAGGFPKKVTAFHPKMKVHGKYKEPCPDCGAPVQRIVRGESEINYCAPCQTKGKLLADRALSRLLKGDWPKTLEALEERKARFAFDEVGEKAETAPAKTGESKKATKKPRSKRGKVSKAGKALVLFAHGAGAPSTSAWMEGWARRLAVLGTVVPFDYPYMAAGKKRPDRHEVLLEAHRAALKKAKLGHRGPIVLAGKSMGSRIGCHLALEEPVDGLVCFGYPLVSAGKTKKVRDAVLLETRTPILFVQGTRDKLCPLERLEEVRGKMTTKSELHVVETGDHSLQCTKTWLKQQGTTQEAVDAEILEAVLSFVGSLG